MENQGVENQGKGDPEEWPEGGQRAPNTNSDFSSLSGSVASIQNPVLLQLNTG